MKSGGNTSQGCHLAHRTILSVRTHDVEVSMIENPVNDIVQGLLGGHCTWRYFAGIVDRGHASDDEAGTEQEE